MDSVIISLPVIFRFLYSTGLRISELVAINEEDVNLKESTCLIKDSKNGQQRLISLSDSLKENCIMYGGYKKQLPRNDSSKQAFFICLNGERVTYKGIHYWFKKILDAAGIPIQFNGKFIRIHDLRHTFAVHSLAGMVESGTDIYCALPILSTYLGHGSLKATDNYLRLTAEFYPELLCDMNMLCLNVFPNSSSYETK